MNEASESGVTHVFGHSVHARSEARYADWLTGLAQAAARAPGGRGTTLVQPTEGGSEYVAFTRFDTPESLRAWLRSAERRSWMSKLRSMDVGHAIDSMHEGMVSWVPRPHDARATPPWYKTAALVLLGLYPLLLVLDVVLSPLLTGLPRPVGLLISLVASVSIMVGSLLPCLTRWFGAWLSDSPPRTGRSSSASEVGPQQARGRQGSWADPRELECGQGP